METSLHRQLKAIYAGDDGCCEVVCDNYRIDAVRGDELIEIQHGSLAAIRDKIRKLLAKHKVRIVKPIVANKLLVKLDERGGAELSRRRSPKRGTLLDVFESSSISPASSRTSGSRSRSCWSMLRSVVIPVAASGAGGGAQIAIFRLKTNACCRSSSRKPL